MKTRSSVLKHSTFFISLSSYVLFARTCEIDTVITAASSDYFDSLQVVRTVGFKCAAVPDELNLQNLVGSIHVHEPQMSTVVYDLGLDRDHIREIDKWDRVQLASIDIDLFPPHVRNLSNYAWKSCVIQQAAAFLPCFLFLDAGMELRDSLADIKAKVANHSNWFVTASNGRGFSSLAGVVHPGTLTIAISPFPASPARIPPSPRP